MEIALKLKDLLILQNNITWVKSISITDKSEDSHGHFKPINSERYINVTNENLYHFTKDDKVKINKKAVGVPYKWKCNLKSRATGEIKEDKRCKGNSWFIPYKTINNKSSKGYHPATFPQELVENCIKLSNIKTGVILDPFVGTGTTIKAAKKMSNEGFNLSGIGIDIDDTYIDFCKSTI
jgi:site-specific DNA-methyltransferase (adenine-specific)